MLPDVIYPVRPGQSNEELKLSLRSLSNLPHGDVYIVGFKPSWIRDVGFIAGGNSAVAPRANLYNNLLLACTHPGLSETITIFNDDMYVVDPIDSVPVLFRGPLVAQWNATVKRAGAKGWWQESLSATMNALAVEGHQNPISYELHTPFPCDRSLMAETLQRFAGVTPQNPPQWRSLYGNMQRIGGQMWPDCKALRPGPLRRPFHSTDDLSLRFFRAKLLQLFPDPSPYEIPQVDARSVVSVPVRKHLRTARRARA